ncbi:hypothetical protein CLOP_g2541 [Closterium sp. NIES-67]|nr:hypothetical protein CLOP_g2541 [Closterium sp. NIES-67]
MVSHNHSRRVEVAVSPRHHTPQEPSPQVQVQVQVQVFSFFGTGSRGAVGGVTCTILTSRLLTCCTRLALLVSLCKGRSLLSCTHSPPPPSPLPLLFPIPQLDWQALFPKALLALLSRERQGGQQEDGQQEGGQQEDGQQEDGQ